MYRILLGQSSNVPAVSGVYESLETQNSMCQTVEEAMDLIRVCHE